MNYVKYHKICKKYLMNHDQSSERMVGINLKEAYQ